MTSSLALLSLILSGWWLPAHASGFVDQLIRSHCIRAISAEMEASGNPAPAGMAEYACDCVVEHFNQGRSIDQAITICKQAAINRFGL